MTPRARWMAGVSLLVWAVCCPVACDKPKAHPQGAAESQKETEAPATPNREYPPDSEPVGESPSTIPFATAPGNEAANEVLAPSSDDGSPRDSGSGAKPREVGGRNGLFSIQVHPGDHLKTLIGAEGRVLLVRGQVRAPEGAGELKKYPYRPASYPWKIRRTAQGYTLQAIGQDTKHHRWYLSFDPALPAKGVFLTEQPTAGSYWNIDRVPAESASGATPLRAVVTDANWQLDFDPDGETFNDLPSGYVTVYQLRLVQGQGARWVVDYFGY